MLSPALWDLSGPCPQMRPKIRHSGQDPGFQEA